MSTNDAPIAAALQNKLLAALPEIEWRRVQQYLSFVESPAGTTICHPGLPLEHAYFPTTSIISVLHVGIDGAWTEIATIGKDWHYYVYILTKRS